MTNVIGTKKTEKVNVERSRERQQEIDKAIYGVAEVYSREITETLMNIYQDTLEQYSAFEIDDALYHWLTSYGEDKFKYFPKPNQIIEYIEGERVKRNKFRRMQE